MATSIAGNLLAVTVNGQKIRCQTAGTLTLTANLTTDAACKPDDATPPEQAGWLTRTVDSRDWSLSVNMKVFLDDLELSGHDLAARFIDNQLVLDDVEFGSTPGQHDYPEDIIYSGQGIIASLTIDGPATGEATHALTIQGNGPLTQQRIPVTT